MHVDLDAIISSTVGAVGRSGPGVSACGRGPRGSVTLHLNDTLSFDPPLKRFRDVRLALVDLRDEPAVNWIGLEVIAEDRSRPAAVRWRPAKAHGWIQASPVKLRRPSKAYPSCLEDLERLTRQVRKGDLALWSVGLTMLPSEMRGYGLGRLLYEQLLITAARHRAAIAPDICQPRGSTSRMAMRVWKALTAAHPHQGWVVVREDLLPKRRGSRQGETSNVQTITRDGFPWPESTPIYHGTYAMDAIERQGFRTRSEGAPSMAGGGHVRSVSATLVPERAGAIALALDTMARVAQRDLTLTGLVQGLLRDAPHQAVDALTAFSGPVRVLAGREAPHTGAAFSAILSQLPLIDEGWSLVSLVGRPPKVGLPYRPPPGSVPIDTGYDEHYLVPPGSPLPLTLDDLRLRAKEEGVPQSDRGTWAFHRAQGWWYGRCEMAFSIYKSVLDTSSYKQSTTFNPILLSTDVGALASVPRSSIGIIVLRSHVPRLCVDARGAERLGYLKASDPVRADKMRSWFIDCEHALDRRAGDELGEKAKTRELFGAWGEGRLREARSWEGWRVLDEGERSPQTTMLYVDGEQEVRIFDTSKISIVERWGMPEIRRRFGLGRRLTWPAFDSHERDVTLWRGASTA